jgi:hypothetical protein
VGCILSLNMSYSQFCYPRECANSDPSVYIWPDTTASLEHLQESVIKIFEGNSKELDHVSLL